MLAEEDLAKLNFEARKNMNLYKTIDSKSLNQKNHADVGASVEVKPSALSYGNGRYATARPSPDRT